MERWGGEGVDRNEEEGWKGGEVERWRGGKGVDMRRGGEGKSWGGTYLGRGRVREGKKGERYRAL